jgi:hypothetical protein
MSTGHFEGFGERAAGVIILKLVKMKLGCPIRPYWQEILVEMW